MYPAPVTLRFEILRSAEPVFFKLKSRLVELPTIWLPKSKFEGAMTRLAELDVFSKFRFPPVPPPAPPQAVNEKAIATTQANWSTRAIGFLFAGSTYLLTSLAEKL